MLHKWRIKWSNADFAVVKCEVQRSGATNTDNTWRWQRRGDYGTPGTEGIDANQERHNEKLWSIKLFNVFFV